MICQHQDVTRTVAQRRGPQRYHIHAMIQIFAKSPAPHFRRQVAIGRRQQPYVELHSLGAAHPFEFALLQNAQKLGLQSQRQFADLVKKHGTALRNLQLSFFLGDRTSERSLLMTEQLALQQRLEMAAQYSGHP
jgi:hypothetical protein